MADFPETNESLIVQVRDPANRAAWERFEQLYRPVIFRIARAKGLQHADALDLVQQVLISVASAIDRYEKQHAGIRFRNWLGRITRNAILKALSRRPRDRASGGSDVLDVEAQVFTLELVKQKQKNEEAIKEGLVTQATEMEAQSNLDTAIVALKEAQADVVKAETEQQLAHEERQALEREMADLQMKLQQVTRLQILAPVAGKVTYIGTFRQSDIVNEGRVICEVTPDPVQPSAPSENTQNTVTTPEPAPAVTPAPMTIFGLEPTLSSSFQGVSGFGPPSELAKRLRESRRRLAQIESSIEDDNAQLKQIQDQLRSLREKREQAEEDDKRRVLDAQIASIQSMQHAKENAIKPRMAAKKIALAELAEVEHEQMTILKLLQNQLAAAHRQLESKQASRERMALNHKLGNSSLDELSRAEEAFVEAESESRQLELLYEFYTNIGRNDAQQKSEEQ